MEDAVYQHFRLGAGDLPEQAGKVDGGRSDPLALTQLLVAGHLLEAHGSEGV